MVLARGLTSLSADLSRPARTLIAALAIGVAGRLLAHRSQAPAALWMVPAILPLLPAPSTLLPALAQTEPARQALQGLALDRAVLQLVADLVALDGLAMLLERHLAGLLVNNYGRSV